jgi:hypothetical protein
MPASFINDPGHWRQRAEEARTIADQMNEPQSKEAMLRIAKDYERLCRKSRTASQGDGSLGIDRAAPIPRA